MSGRSPSGFASLRARFEHNSESTSPPSRGRSPAGSATSDISRPISKVRTSFVSVEGSGIMSDQLNLKENETAVSDGKEPSNGNTKVVTADKPQNNGKSSIAQERAEMVQPKNDSKLGPAKVGATDGGMKSAGLDGCSDANPNGSVSTTGDNTANTLPADPEGEETVSGGAALAGESPGLGSILKGSPFEQNGVKKATQLEPSTSKTKDPISGPQPSKSQAKPSASGLGNGRPKEVPISKPGALLDPKTSGSNDSGRPKVTPVMAPSTAPITSEKKPATKTPPGALATKADAADVLPASGEPARKKSVEIEQAEPQTPADVSTTAQQSIPSKASPKLGKSKEPKKDTAKNAKEPVGRPSMISKLPASTAPKSDSTSITSATRPLKKQGPNSPKSTFTKPRPKSPTRPMKLSVAATAPTAASAAKLDGAPPSSNDRKPMNHPSLQQKRVVSNTTKPHPKPVRTSLPVGSRLDNKLKAPRSRQSMASTRAPEGSFLDRMMRPTQSSSQKTHEKVEAKTPPKKQSATRPKRMSEGSNKSKSENVDVSNEPAHEPSGEASGSQETNGEIHSASAAAHTIPTTIPVP